VQKSFWEAGILPLNYARAIFSWPMPAQQRHLAKLHKQSVKNLLDGTQCEV